MAFRARKAGADQIRRYSWAKERGYLDNGEEPLKVDRGGIWSESHSVVSNSLWPLGLWNFPGQNTGVGSHSLFQEIFPRDRTQVSCVAGGFFIS